MKTIEMTEIADAGKLLHLTIPVDDANRAYRVVVVITPEKESSTLRRERKGWPPGFIESTYGSIQDESFIRQPQGEPERRLEFE